MNGLSQPWVDACLFYEPRVSVDSRPTYTGLLRYSWSQLRRKAVKRVTVVVATISATHLLRLDDAPRHTTMFDKWHCPLHCARCNRSDVQSTSIPGKHLPRGVCKRHHSLQSGHAPGRLTDPDARSAWTARYGSAW